MPLTGFDNGEYRFRFASGREARAGGDRLSWPDRIRRPRHENRNQEVAFLSRRLKTLAMDYNVPILAAHQLNRSNESESRKPSLSDLRDSGALEQDADVVLLLDSPARRSKQVSPDAPPDAIDVIVAKQRNGPRGMTVQLRLEAKFCRLEEA